MYERTRRLTHDDYENKFSYLLETNNEVTFHAKNNQKLMTEVYEYFSGLCHSDFCKKIFSKRNIENNLRKYRN